MNLLFRHPSYQTDNHPRIAFIIVLPEIYTQESQTHWQTAAALEYSRPNPTELASQLIQFLNFLSNKGNCPQLSHLTIDSSGIDSVQLEGIKDVKSTDINPINVDSLRLIGTSNDNVPYGIIDHCVDPPAMAVSHITEFRCWSLNTVRRLHLVVLGDSTDLRTVDAALDVRVLEWLSIDGYDEIFNYPVVRSCPQAWKLRLVISSPSKSQMVFFILADSLCLLAGSHAGTSPIPLGDLPSA